MSVGILKRLLSIVNVVAVLAIAWTAYGFVSHRSELNEAWQEVGFGIEGGRHKREAIRIDNTGMQLGLYPQPVEVDPNGEVKETAVEIEAEIDKLGTIESAIVVYPPYAGTRPALTFQFKTEPIPGKGKIYTIKLGGALITRPHSDPVRRDWGDRENVRFEFVGCKPDPENPDWTLFQFDVNCDGKITKTARWKSEVKKIVLRPAKPIVREAKSTRVLRDPSAKKPGRVETPKPDGGARPGPKPEVKPVRIREPIPEVTGPIFQNENGAFAPTEAGVAYLRDNYNKILKDTQTAPYADKSGKTTGLKIHKIAKNSVANQFGIREGDIILRVNTTRVRSKAQAVNAVKRELNKKVRYIEVEVKRLGAKKILRFDSHDPATRRKAKAGFRNRR